MCEKCTKEEKIGYLDKTAKDFESFLVRFDQFTYDLKNNDLAHIYDELRKFSQRPSWPIVIVISSLTSICGILLTLLMGHLLGKGG